MEVRELSREEPTHARTQVGDGPASPTNEATTAQAYYSAAAAAIENAMSVNSQEFVESSEQQGGQ